MSRVALGLGDYGLGFWYLGVQALGFRVFEVQGLGCAGQVACSGVKRPWRCDCVACKPHASMESIEYGPP